MQNNKRIVIESDFHTPLQYISDTICYSTEEKMDVRTDFLALFGVDGQKTFFKTLFYIFKLKNDIGDNEFSDVLLKYIGNNSVFNIFNYYACDQVLEDRLYLNELFSIVDINYDDIKEINKEYKKQKIYRKRES